METNDNVVQFPTQEDAVEASVTTGEFDLEKAKHLFSISESINAINDLKSNINARRLSVISNEDVYTEIEQRLTLVTVEEINAAKPEVINEVFKFNGEDYKIEIPFETPEAEVDFKRGFLVFLKESGNAMIEIDNQMVMMEEEIAKEQDDFNKLIENFGNLDTFVENQLREGYEKAEGDDKVRLGKMVDSYDNAVSFNNVYNHYQNQNTSNVIGDMKSRAQGIYDKYRKIVSHMDIKSDIADFDDLESRFLPEKYHAHPNLFLFSIIKMVAYRKDNAEKTVEGVFLSQLNVNLRQLYSNKMDAAKKEKFLTGVSRVLDLFI